MNTPASAIPRWMMALNVIILAILAFKAWACFADPAAIFGAAPDYGPAHVKALWELGGRNIAMMATGLFALARPSRAAYVLIFLMGFFREGADMLFAALPGLQDPSALLQASAFLIFLVPYAIALRQLLRRAA